MRLLKAAAERLHQPIFELSGVRRESARSTNVIIGKADRRRSFPFTEFPPGKVVERAQRVGDTPMRHNASGIGLDCLLKACDPFLMVEPKAPIQSEIEPALCLGRMGGNRSGVSPEVEVLHGSPVNPARCGRRLDYGPGLLSRRDRYKQRSIWSGFGSYTKAMQLGDLLASGF